MKLKTSVLTKFTLAIFCICFSSFSIVAQEDLRIQYFPANDVHYAGIHSYSTESGEIQQYYVLDGEWVKNEEVGQPDISISKGDIRMEFFPADSTALAGLFVYSVKTGEFESFYLMEKGWRLNDNYPAGKSSLSGNDFRLEFFPAINDQIAYLTAHSTNDSEFEILYVKDGEWVKNEFFPMESKIGK